MKREVRVAFRPFDMASMYANHNLRLNMVSWNVFRDHQISPALDPFHLRPGIYFVLLMFGLTIFSRIFWLGEVSSTLGRFFMITGTLVDIFLYKCMKELNGLVLIAHCFRSTSMDPSFIFMTIRFPFAQKFYVELVFETKKNGEILLAEKKTFLIFFWMCKDGSKIKCWPCF